MIGSPIRYGWRCALASGLLLAATAASGRDLAAGGTLYVDPASSTATAAAGLSGQAKADALTLAKLPSATWLTGGTPANVQRRADEVMQRAAAVGAIPVLVAYDIPLRDCSLYSAGGAADGAAYLDWIKGLAAGLGKGHAIIVLEPDSLGVIPWHRTLDGKLESCQTKDVDPASAAEARYAQLRGAVDILAALPNVHLYLDGTTSSWLSPGEAASRLIRANVAKAAGFFLNVSNFESDARLTHYAHWVSDCLALVTAGGYLPRNCPGQYGPATFADVTTWRRTDEAYDRLFQETEVRRSAWKQKHAIIDTSRNGRGSWSPPAGKYADAEIWCNPPGRGLGRQPTLKTGDGYVDAFLWIKTPGESDGQCLRGTKGPTDPERAIIDPPAGQWFPEQAHELLSLGAGALSDQRDRGCRRLLAGWNEPQVEGQAP